MPLKVKDKPAFQQENERRLKLLNQYARVGLTPSGFDGFITPTIANGYLMPEQFNDYLYQNISTPISSINQVYNKVKSGQRQIKTDLSKNADKAFNAIRKNLETAYQFKALSQITNGLRTLEQTKQYAGYDYSGNQFYKFNQEGFVDIIKGNLNYQSAEDLSELVLQAKVDSYEQLIDYTDQQLELANLEADLLTENLRANLELQYDQIDLGYKSQAIQANKSISAIRSNVGQLRATRQDLFNNIGFNERQLNINLAQIDETRKQQSGILDNQIYSGAVESARASIEMSKFLGRNQISRTILEKRAGKPQDVLSSTQTLSRAVSTSLLGDAAIESSIANAFAQRTREKLKLNNAYKDLDARAKIANREYKSKIDQAHLTFDKVQSNITKNLEITRQQVLNQYRQSRLIHKVIANAYDRAALQKDQFKLQTDLQLAKIDLGLDKLETNILNQRLTAFNQIKAFNEQILTNTIQTVNDIEANILSLNYQQPLRHTTTIDEPIKKIQPGIFKSYDDTLKELLG